MSPSITHPKISIVLPCYNEEGVIAKTVTQVQTWAKSTGQSFEIIVVDDGSHDGSGKVLTTLKKKFRTLRVMTHAKNKGYAAAIRSGMDNAKGTYIAFMDSDGQFHANDLQKLLEKMSRFPFAGAIRKHRADSPMRTFNSHTFAFVVRILFGVKAKDMGSGMRMMHRGIWKLIRPTIASGGLLEAEIFSRLHSQRIPFIEVSVRHFPRTTGNPTGARLHVIFKALKELLSLFIQLKMRTHKVLHDHRLISYA